MTSGEAGEELGGMLPLRSVTGWWGEGHAPEGWTVAGVDTVPGNQLSKWLALTLDLTCQPDFPSIL